MKKSNKDVYTVTMYKNGDRQSHSYILGVFRKKDKAMNEADKEEKYRGDTYTAEVLEIRTDEKIEYVMRGYFTIKYL